MKGQTKTAPDLAPWPHVTRIDAHQPGIVRVFANTGRRHDAAIFAWKAVRG